MHLQDAAHTLTVVLYGVVNSAARLNGTGVHAEEAQLTDKRVGSNLKCQSSEGSFVVRRTGLLFFCFGIDTFDVLDVGRSRHIVNNGIQQFLYALVLVRSTANHGNDGVRNGFFTDGFLDLRNGDLFAVQILHHQLLIALGDGLDHLVVILICQLHHILRNRLCANILAKIIVVDISLHLEQVDDAFKGFLFANGQLNGHSIGFQTLFNHVQNTIEVCAHDIHLIDVNHARNVIFVGLVPNSLRLRLHAALCAHDSNRTVQHTQGTLHLYGEIHVTRCVDDVNSVSVLFGKSRIMQKLGVAPVTSGSSRSNRDTTLLLLCHPVHRRSAVVRFTNLVIDACVEQDTLGGGSFTGVDVSHNADVSCHLKRNVSRHSTLLKV